MGSNTSPRISYSNKFFLKGQGAFKDQYAKRFLRSKFSNRLYSQKMKTENMSQVENVVLHSKGLSVTSCSHQQFTPMKEELCDHWLKLLLFTEVAVLPCRLRSG